LVGRDAELAYLHNRFNKALDGERQVIFVSGEPGIGKTTLVDAFLEQIGDRPDVRTTSGQCVEQYGPGEAYLPLLEATTRLCRVPGGERRIEALQRYAPSWLAQLPGLLAPQARDLLQQQAQGASRERMLREMAEAAELFATQRGLVVVLEDLHWSDVSTLDWVTYMARRREPAKLLILGTYRPTETLINHHPLRGAVQELLARRYCEELQVTPLAEAAIMDYLRGRFGEVGWPEALTTTLVRRTGGNPLFLVNMVDYLVRQDAVTEVDGQWIVREEKVTELAERVPDTLRQLIERQVERLSEAEQRLLEVASVVGVEFAGAEVAAGLATSVEDIETTCGRFAHLGQWLCTAGLAEWPDGTLSGRYRFLHALYHEVIYARIAEARRIQLHRRIAARKEAAYGERTREIAAELAVHFERGREYAKAVQRHRQAGEAAARAGAPQEALSHLQRGLELLTLLPDNAERLQQEVRLQLALANPLYAIGGRTALQEMERAYLRAHELCQRVGEPPQLASVLFGLCMVYELRGEVHKSLALAQQLLTLAQRVQNPGLLLRAHMALGNVLYFLGDFTASRHHLEQALTIYDPDKHSPRVSNIAQDLGVVCLSRAGWVLWCLGYPEQARRSSDKGLALAHELSHFLSEAFALDGAIGVAQECGELAAVERHVERMITLSQEQGFPYCSLWGTMVRGWLLTVQGKGVEGITQLRHGINALLTGGQELGLLYFMGLLVEAYGITKQVEEGLTVLTEALAIAERRGERFYAAELYRLRGELLLRSGDAETAQEQSEIRRREESGTRRRENLLSSPLPRFSASPVPSAASPKVQPADPIPNAQSPVPAAQDSAPGTQEFALFRREGEYWTLSFAGTTCRLKEARGLHYIAQLLHHPHHDFHVISLLGASPPLNSAPSDARTAHDPNLSLQRLEGFSDAGEVLDPQARAAYKQRVNELQAELAEAQQFHDLGRSEQLAAEIDFLTHELTRAVGLGGRARRVGSPAERARVNITRAIKIALRKIAEHHPVLGHHLATTIKTGTYCAYTPDPRLPIRWQD
jgi:tetratricopeptide (TPR) repeat protein